MAGGNKKNRGNKLRKYSRHMTSAGALGVPDTGHMACIRPLQPLHIPRASESHMARVSLMGRAGCCGRPPGRQAARAFHRGSEGRPVDGQFAEHKRAGHAHLFWASLRLAYLACLPASTASGRLAYVHCTWLAAMRPVISARSCPQSAAHDDHRYCGSLLLARGRGR